MRVRDTAASKATRWSLKVSLIYFCKTQIKLLVCNLLSELLEKARAFLMRISQNVKIRPFLSSMDERSRGHTFGGLITEDKNRKSSADRNQVSPDISPFNRTANNQPNKVGPTPLIYRARPKEEIRQRHKEKLISREMPDFHTPHHPHVPIHPNKHRKDSADEEQKLSEPPSATSKNPVQDPRNKQPEQAAEGLTSEIVRGYYNDLLKNLSKVPENDTENRPVSSEAQTEANKDVKLQTLLSSESEELWPQSEHDSDVILKSKKTVRISDSIDHRSISALDTQGSYKIQDVGRPEKEDDRSKPSSRLPRIMLEEREKSKVYSTAASSPFGDPSMTGREDSIYRAPTMIVPSSASANDTEEQGSDQGSERPEYASDPKEFTKTGTPMPFWYFEMKKGTEYIMKLHRKYGQRHKHERVPLYKPDMEIVSIDTKASDESMVIAANKEMYHIGLKHLIPLDRLFLFHRVVINDAIFYCCNKVQNEYRVLNHHGHFVYRVVEQKKRCKRSSFVFMDFEEDEVIKILPLGARRFEIQCPVNSVIGYVVHERTRCLAPPQLAIFDENNTEIIKFDRIAPRFKDPKNPDLLFEYQSVRGQGPLGVVTTKLADLKMANFTENDYYGIRISEQLPPNIKVRIVAAWFVIYGIFYKGRAYKEMHHCLTTAAQKLYLDKMPETQEIPERLQGGLESDTDKPEED